jgi:integrase
MTPPQLDAAQERSGIVATTVIDGELGIAPKRFAVEGIQKRVDEILARPLAASTAGQYARAMVRMTATGQRPEQIGSRSRRSYHLYRAAMVRETAHQIWLLIEQAEALRKKADVDTWCPLASRIERLARILDRYPPGGGGGTAWQAPSEGVRRTGKRAGLGSLPQTWRETLFDRFRGGRYEAAIAVLWLSGVRPTELVRGVEVGQSAGKIVLRVHGAKISDVRGQPVRVMVYECGSVPAASLIASLAAAPQGRVVVRVDNARRLCDAVRAASRRAWPKSTYVVTPYSYRHQVSSNLKHAGWPRRAIAAALGHLSAESQGAYGMSGQSRGQSELVAVSASREILHLGAHKPWNPASGDVETSDLERKSTSSVVRNSQPYDFV